MSFATTSFAVTTTPSLLIGATTTAFRTLDATRTDPVPFTVFNESTSVPIRIGGSSSTGQTGVPVAPTANLTFTLINQADQVWGFTTGAGSTAFVSCIAGRQG